MVNKYRKKKSASGAQSKPELLSRNSQNRWNLLRIVTRRTWESFEGIMIARMTAEGRILGFNAGDWLLLLGGSALAGLLTFLVA
jgi:hypothetical protein